MLRPRLIPLFVWLCVLTAQASLAQEKAAQAKLPAESLLQLVNRHFAHWDRNHDNALELVEIDRAIEDHSVRARQAAVVVCLRNRMTAKDHPSKLSREELARLLGDHDFIMKVEQTAHHLATIDRELFLPTDPDLKTFHQGHLGDCYLLAPIAAQIHRNPKVIREMIHPEVTGGFRVDFHDGRKIEVPPLTDGELLLGARLDERHGSWLAVLEKAYGIIRRRERMMKGDEGRRAAATIPVETLNGGDSGSIISLLTGHLARSLELKKASQPDEVHHLLADLTKKKRLVCVGKGKEKGPPGILSNHLYAVLGYDTRERIVIIFNPWGNQFKPKGAPGMSNGYPTENGCFSVPIDEFQKIFHDVIYETNQKAGEHA
jgi:hypothetical protein